MIQKDKLAKLKAELIHTKKEIEERFNENDHYQLERENPYNSVGELSAYDNHPGDLGTELYEREKDIALNEHTEKELADINHALQAMENGTYGKCEVCGKDIDEERLEAIPSTTYCKEHSPNQIVSHNRPVEEGVLMPAFGKFEFDDEEAVTFDSEDTWQIVSEYGTSESPSDLDNRGVDHYNDVYVESGENEGYVEDFENFIGTDMYGKEIKVYNNDQHEKYEQQLDEEGIMTSFGDLPGYEKDPYTEEALEEDK
ncbi:TraR/DksA C4-type zinc finger protein [Sutcliffiella cohnii]